jgi:hypothetical protein
MAWDDAAHGGGVRSEDGGDEDVATDEELLVDPEELVLVGELEEQRAYGRGPTDGSVREQ